MLTTNKLKVSVAFVVAMFVLGFVALFPSCAIAEESNLADGVSVSGAAWTSDDFTYADVQTVTSSTGGEPLYPEGVKLYGCDYSRQFYLKGIVVSGFSESGAQKLADGNTDIVIPRTDTEGNVLIGIGPSAFREKGLTSVEFPTGMKTDYVDETTKYVSRRGNFVILEGAFSKNNLTEVNLPEGVIACMPNSFFMNKLEKVKLPRTIWWIENQAFARNQISEVVFPTTTDFQLEIHGSAFGSNNIKSLRLPDFTAVVNKTAFVLNPGLEAISDACTNSSIKNGGGVVYMYTDNLNLQNLDRIHTTDRATESQHSWCQKLISEIGAYKSDVQWLSQDFTYEDTENYRVKITGLSESGIAKRKVNPDLAFPDVDSRGRFVVEIAGTTNNSEFEGGVFATADEKLRSVTFPSLCKTIGDNSFRCAGLKDAVISNDVETIGLAAFQQNNLSSIILPDSVKSIGAGCFATNPTLEKIDLSNSLTEIPGGAFGCSDGVNYMTNLTSIKIPESITSIGQNAFAGNNFHEINIPKSVKSIGKYAFSTKNYLSDECKLTLEEGLVSIGDYAFRNKVIKEVHLPTTVEELKAKTFIKQYSDSTHAVVTKVYVSKEVQATDKTKFPTSEYHEIILDTNNLWVASDFTYDNVVSSGGDSIRVVTGLSESGQTKASSHKNLVIPSSDTTGATVQGIGAAAFKGQEFTSVSFGRGTGKIEIGDEAFAGCRLDSMVLPDELVSIGKSSFADNNLTTLNIPSTLSTIPESAFENNAFKELVIPGYVHVIEKNAFYNPSPASDYISSLSLNEGLMTVADNAFGGLKASKAELPSTVSELSELAFGDTTSNPVALHTNCKEIVDGLTNLPAKGKNFETVYDKLTLTGWSSEDFTYVGSAITGFSETGKVKRESNLNLVLPDVSTDGTVITEISGYVAPTKLSDVNQTVVDEGNPVFGVPESEISFGSSDKGNVISPNGLKSVILPASLQEIGENAFRYNNLEIVQFPETLTSIGTTAFKGNKLTNIYLPDSVTSCGDGCFSNNNITKARLSEQMPIIPDGFLSMNIRMENITLPECITDIGQTAFAGARLTELTIPSNVTHIGRKAFHLHHLSELTIPGNVKTIDDNAFEGTFKGQTLKSLTIEEGVESIGNGCFKEGLLTEVTLPASVKSFGYKVFENNVGIDPENGDHRVKVLYSDASQESLFTEGDNTILIEKDDTPIENPINVTRLSGDDCYGTNLDTIKNDIETNGLPAGVIVCGTSHYLDSLSAAALSGMLDYPVLLVNGSDDAINSTSLEALNELTGGGSRSLDIIVLGGKFAISDGIESQLCSYDRDGACDRIFGDDGYATNRAVYDFGNTRGSWNANEVLVASGAGYHDALGAGSYAMANDSFILLVNPYGDNAPMVEKASHHAKATVLGGFFAVPQDVENSLTSSGVATSRIAGDDAYQTNIAFVTYAVSNGMSIEGAGFSSGLGYYDALGSSHNLGKTKSVMFLASLDESLNQGAYDLMKSSGASIKNAKVFGGLAVISSTTENAIKNVLQ